MGRKKGAGSKRDFFKESKGETTRVSVLYVTVPDAKLRLEQALEVLLSGTLSPGEIIADQDLRGDENGDDSAADGDVP
jgi:hypothetical protein